MRPLSTHTCWSDALRDPDPASILDFPRFIAIFEETATRHVRRFPDINDNRREIVSRAGLLLFERFRRSGLPADLLEDVGIEELEARVAQYCRCALRYATNHAYRWEGRHHPAGEAVPLESLADPRFDSPDIAVILADAMSHLSEDDCRRVRMHYLEERTYGEVATELGESETTARTKVKHIVERLRRRFGVNPPDGD